MNSRSRPAGRDRLTHPPTDDALGEDLGCLTVLGSPSCFGFLAFVGILLAICACHDLAI
jgi:hypothetical protein